MPEEVQDAKSADTQGAPEPSTGTTITPPSSPEAYSKWRLTGEVPAEKKPSKKEPAPSSAEEEPREGDEPEEEDSEEKTAPAPEAGRKKQEQHYRKGSAQDRLDGLLADLRRAGLSPSELKTFKREMMSVPVPQQVPPQQSVQPPAQPQRLAEPKLEDFRTWDEFRAAERAYSQQVMADQMREFYQQIQAQQIQQAAQQQAAERLAYARQRYGEEAEGSITAAARGLFGDQNIHPAIKGIVNDSPAIADLLYVMGYSAQDFDQFIQVARVNPGEAIRRVVLLEQLVKDELRKAHAPANGNGKSEAAPVERETPARDESGRFISAPQKKEVSAPPPATEVSGRASPPPNDAEAAFNRGDVRAYFSAKNRAQLAERKR